MNASAILGPRIGRIERLIHAVGRPGDLMPSQWVQLMAFALEFKPDFILELGRGYGNSACAFTEVCHLLPPSSCTVLSLCLSDDWDKRTAPRLREVVDPGWFEPLTALTTDILQYDYEKAFSGKKRILVFWDAHGYEIAEVVLGYILPLISDRENLVIMHDLSDARFITGDQRLYGDNGIWKGKNTWEGPRFRIGPIDSCVEQGIAILDFCARNQLPLHSSDESFFQELGDDQWNRLLKTFGPLDLSRNGHWFWFSLSEAPIDLTYPKPVARKILTTKEMVTPPQKIQAPDETVQRTTDTSAISYHPESGGDHVPFTVTLFRQEGRSLVDALEKNIYGPSDSPPVTSDHDRFRFHPTTSRDHLATGFLKLLPPEYGGTRLVIIRLRYDPGDVPAGNCEISLQDEEFQTSYQQPLAPENLKTGSGNVEYMEYVVLKDRTQKVRLLLATGDGGPTPVPVSMAIEQAVADDLFFDSSFVLTLFRHSGKELADSLEKNYYGAPGEKPPLSTDGVGLCFTPTSPRDHLTTPFLSFLSLGSRGTRVMKVTLACPDPNISSTLGDSTILLQDQDMHVISHDLLSPENREKRMNGGVLTDYFVFDETIKTVRIFIISKSGEAATLPNSLVVQQALPRSGTRDRMLFSLMKRL